MANFADDDDLDEDADGDLGAFAEAVSNVWDVIEEAALLAVEVLSTCPCTQSTSQEFCLYIVCRVWAPPICQQMICVSKM